MAKVTTKTLAGGTSFDRIQEYIDEIPVDVIDEMLTAEADVIEPAIADNAASMLRGPYAVGDTSRALYRKKPANWGGRKGNGQRQIALTFRGIRRNDKYHPNGTRNAEIAFVNEYGNRGNPARPFVQRAIDEKAEAAFDNAEKVFDDWLKKEKMI